MRWTRSINAQCAALGEVGAAAVEAVRGEKLPGGDGVCLGNRITRVSWLMGMPVTPQLEVRDEYIDALSSL